MKKLLAGLFSAGLLLSTATTVFAAEGETTQTTDVSSEIAATYVVTIPAELSIDIMGGTSNNTGVVTLDSLTALGAVSVNATVNDLALAGGTGLPNETLTTTIQADAETPAGTSAFSLTNSLPTKDITVETEELSQNNLPGQYNGTIDFIFDFVVASAE